MKDFAFYISLLFLLGLIACNEEEPTPIKVAFGVDKQRIQAGESVNFSDETLGNPVSWHWTFEGGEPSESREQNPIVRYTADGRYHVVLTASNGESTETVEVANFIEVSSPSNLACGDRFLSPDFLVGPRLNVVYGINASQHKMNIYAPLNDPSATKPVVLLASGGSFVNQGDLERMEPLCKMLSSYGLIVAAVNYRNVPGAQSDPRLYSEAISKADQDISAAVRYFRKEAATYGVDTAAIFTGGYSSGAIASIAQAYVSYNEIFESQRYLYPEGKYGVQGNPGFNSKSIGLISISGEINSRLSFIEKDDPHFFGVCSLNDPGVTCDSSFSQFGGFAKYGAEAIASYASSIGLISDYYYFTGDDHQITINDPASYESRLLPFIRSVLCKENPPKPPTLYNEAFGTNVLASGVWSTFSLVDDQQNWTWNEELQFMESNNFDSERSPEFMADDWLITPEINLGQFENPMLSFEYALKFDDLEGYGLSVFVAINNDHNDQFDEFDWIPISENNTFSEPTTGANYMDFVDSGKILLHEYAGQNINIAFRYSSSGSGTNTAFRVAIDNVIID